jgi:TRAP-type C4-dicarboxylate transport system permease small subunit
MTAVLLRRLAFAFALAGSVVACGVALMVVISVVGRGLLRAPVPGDVELTQLGIALAISLALPWCQWQRAHVEVDFFVQRAGAASQRWLAGAGALLLAGMCLLLAWRTGAGAIAVRAAHEQSMILGLPMWWAYASLAPGLALAALVALWQAALPSPNAQGMVR